MELKALFGGDQFSTFYIIIVAGDQNPHQMATQDAYLVILCGMARLKFEQSEVLLQQGSGTFIPPEQAHTLEVLVDLEAYLILAAGGGIEFPDKNSCPTSACSLFFESHYTSAMASQPFKSMDTDT